MTSRRLPSDAGLSLIEILVAIAILAVLATIVTLTMPSANDPLREEADRLALRFRHASQEAIVRGQPVGFTVRDDGAGYAFSTYQDGRWWALDAHPSLGRHRMEDSVEARFPDRDRGTTSGEQSGLQPDIWFDPTAMTDPFVLRLARGGDQLELTWSASGELHVEEVG